MFEENNYIMQCNNNVFTLLKYITFQKLKNSKAEATMKV